MNAIEQAHSFVTTHARLLDRRRFELLFAGGAAQGVLDALGAYANDDGGFGWGLEPDHRVPGSQPGAAITRSRFWPRSAP